MLCACNYIHTYMYMRQGSSVGIPMGFEVDCRFSIPGRGKRFFSLPWHPDRLWGLPSLILSEYLGLFPLEVKRPGRESDHHSPLSIADVKNDGVIHPLTHKSSSCCIYYLSIGTNLPLTSHVYTYIDTYTLIYIVTCRFVAGQRPRDEQIYNNRY
jgi:hypothetical protein